MENARKASDILLDLVNKVEQLLNLSRSQDLNFKILSNKLNLVMEQMKGAGVPIIAAQQTYSASADNSMMPQTMLKNRATESVLIADDVNSISVDENPSGFRRTSRPETFTANSIAQSQVIKPKQPLQNKVLIQDPAPPSQDQLEAFEQFKPFSDAGSVAAIDNVAGLVAVTQRVLDKNNKSVFLADVVIADKDGKQVSKIRTNGMGKWTAALPTGIFMVKVSKRESVTRQSMEATQSIVVDGKESKLALDQLIIK